MYTLRSIDSLVHSSLLGTGQTSPPPKVVSILHEYDITTITTNKKLIGPHGTNPPLLLWTVTIEAFRSLRRKTFKPRLTKLHPPGRFPHHIYCLKLLLPSY